MRAEIVLGLFLEKQRRESFVARSIVFLSTYVPTQHRALGKERGGGNASVVTLALLSLSSVRSRRSCRLCRGVVRRDLSLLRANSTPYIDNFTLL